MCYNLDMDDSEDYISADSLDEFMEKLDAKRQNRNFIQKMIDYLDVYFHRSWLFMRMIPKNIKYFFQRIFQGSSDNETWSLYSTSSDKTLKLLKRFKKLNNGHPAHLTADKWDNYIDDMIFYHENIDADLEMWAWFERDPKTWDEHRAKYSESYKQVTKEAYERFIRGKYLYNKYYSGLWW